MIIHELIMSGTRRINDGVLARRTALVFFVFFALLFSVVLAGNLRIEDANNNTLLFINNETGNVGIGTTDANYKLTVDGSIIVSGANNNRALYLTQYSNTGAGRYTGAIIPSAGSNGISLWYHDGSNYYEGLRLHSDGRVGIGTASPKKKLDVLGDFNTTGIIYFGSSAIPIKDLGGGYFSFKDYFVMHKGGHKLFMFNKDQSGNRLVAGSGFEIRNEGESDNNAFKLSVFGNDSAGTATSPLLSFSIDSDGVVDFAQEITVSGAGDSYFLGNLGIGATSPSADLDITHGQVSDLMLKSEGHEIYNATLIINWADNAFQLKVGTYPVLVTSGYNTPEITRLYSNNAETMTLNNGNVGIGTADPGDRLTVGGNVRVGLVTNDDGGTAGYGNYLYFSGGDDWTSYNSDNSDVLWLARYNIASDQTELRMNIGDRISDSNDKFVVGTTDYTEGGWNPHFAVRSDGKVGINTTSPDALLDITGNGALLDINNNADGTSYVRFAQNSVDRFAIRHVIAGDYLGVYDYGESADTIVFKDGNVGIGTTSPSARLEVRSTGNPIVKFGDANNIGQLVAGGSYVAMQNSAGNGVTILQSNGNVGIGTTNPQNKLNVVGDVNATSNLYVGGSLDLDGDLVVGGGWGGGGITLTSDGDLKIDGDIYQKSGHFYYSDATSYNGSFYIADNLRVGAGIGGKGGHFNVTADGNVVMDGSLGVGTASPGGKLDVLTGSTNDGANGNPDNLLKIQSANGDDGVLDVNAITIKQNGNVGIRKPNPSYPLDVSGDIYSSGNIRFNNLYVNNGGAASGLSPGVR